MLIEMGLVVLRMQGVWASQAIVVTLKYEGYLVSDYRAENRYVASQE